MEEIANAIETWDEWGSKLLICGNGGSSTTASHFAGDLSKTCNLEAHCLSDSQYLITAHGNDDGYFQIFSKQVERIGYQDDVLIVISGSGKSENVVRAVKEAKQLDMKTIGLTGMDGGLLKDLCDICLIVPSNHMEVIEDVHLAVCHCIVEMLKES